jgi:hypothetical protein
MKGEKNIVKCLKVGERIHQRKLTIKNKEKAEKESFFFIMRKLFLLTSTSVEHLGTHSFKETIN